MNFIMIENSNIAFAQRLNSVLQQLSITPYKFSKQLHYDSPEVICGLLDGNFSPDENFWLQIGKVKLPVEMDWLKYGSRDPIVFKPLIGGIGNEINIGNGTVYPCFLGFGLMKNLGILIAHYTIPNKHYFKIEAKKSIELGIEFRFTCFAQVDEEDKFVIDRRYSVTIAPDWKVVSFFEFWKTPSGYLRCEDCSSGYTSELCRVIFEIQSDIMEWKNQNTRRKLVYSDLFDDGMPLTDENFICLHSSDERLKGMTESFGKDFV